MKTYPPMPRRSDLQPPENVPGWLTTFNDLMTLLMVFFVLLFALSGHHSKEYMDFLNCLQSGMGVLNEGRNTASGVISDRQQPLLSSDADGERPLNLPRIEGVEAEYTSQGLRITLADLSLFRSGSARLTEQGAALLNEICAVLRPMHRRIRVEGHTDDRIIATPRYPSNWELSTARAISVVNFMIQRGGIAPVHLSAAGYADCKPRVPNDSAHRRGMNRRVEIVLYEDGRV